ncbi:MAG: hypothetical protein ACRC37_06085 [Lentisphaeria bacterium]
MNRILTTFFILMSFCIGDDFSFLKFDGENVFADGGFYSLTYQNVSGFDIKDDKEKFINLRKDEKLMKLLATRAINSITNKEIPSIEGTILVQNDDQIKRLAPVLAIYSIFNSELFSQKMISQLMNKLPTAEKCQLLGVVSISYENLAKNRELYGYLKLTADKYFVGLAEKNMQNVIMRRKNDKEYKSFWVNFTTAVDFLSYLDEADVVFYSKKLIGGSLFYSDSVEMQNFLLGELKVRVKNSQILKPELSEKIIHIINELR